MLSYFFYIPEKIKNELSDKEGIDNPLSLLSEIFLIKINSIESKGFNKHYSLVEDSSFFIRGKINIIKTEQKRAFNQHTFSVYFDDLNYDTIENQYIKYALSILLKNKEIIKTNILLKVKKIFSQMEYIKNKTFTDKDFQKINQNNKLDYYRSTLFFANLIISSFIPGKIGQNKSLELIYSKAIYEKIFEGFIANFYIKHRKEINADKVTKQKNISWYFDEVSNKNTLLPGMYSDIVIEKENEDLIIDTKLYTEYVKINQYGKEKLISANIYQLFTYATNHSFNTSKKVNGQIIYANIENEPLLNENFEFKNGMIKISLKTINLFQDFNQIKRDLIEFVS
jgi:5-methylcytosine-specific restriction enzyme subunit McrC